MVLCVSSRFGCHLAHGSCVALVEFIKEVIQFVLYVLIDSQFVISNDVLVHNLNFWVNGFGCKCFLPVFLAAIA